MQFFTSLFIVVSLALTVISTPVFDKDSSLAARDFSDDIDARSLDENLIFSRARIINGARAEDVEDMERRATTGTKTFSTLKQQLSVVSNAGVTLQSAIFQLSSNSNTTSFGQIMSIYSHLNTFITSSQAVYKSVKTLAPVKTQADAAAVVDLVKPLIGSVNVSVQGLVSNKNTFLNCGIGCIIEFLLALILFILAAILEILIFIISCNLVAVQELTDIQTSTQTSIKAAIAVFRGA